MIEVRGTGVGVREKGIFISPLTFSHLSPPTGFDHTRYELGLKTATFFGSTALGTALHQALAQSYRDWHYEDPLPKLDWLHHCWEQNSKALSPDQGG